MFILYWTYTVINTCQLDPYFYPTDKVCNILMNSINYKKVEKYCCSQFSLLNILCFLQIWLWNEDLGAFGDLFTYNTLRWFIQLIFTSFTCLKKIKRSNIYIRFFSFFCSLPLNAYISPIVYSAPFLNKLNITLLIHSSS